MSKISEWKKQLEGFLDSEEGKKAIEEFKKELEVEQKRFDRWFEKIKKYILNYSGNFDELFEKVLKHNKKYSDIKWHQGYDSESPLLSILIGIFEEIGESKETDNHFASCMYVYKGWGMESMIGQGSFICLFKIN